MIPLAAALAALLVSHASGDIRWSKPPDSLAGVTGFRVGVNLHAKPSALGGISQEAIRAQIEAALRKDRIAVDDVGPEDPHDGGFLILDVHVVSTPGARSSIAWTLHASQLVRLQSGAAALASTWEVGDLLDVPEGAGPARLRESLQPALDEFCAAYVASRARGRRAAPAVDL